MKVRDIVKRKQEQQGWPNTSAGRFKQSREWDGVSTDRPESVLCRSVRWVAISYPTRSWRERGAKS